MINEGKKVLVGGAALRELGHDRYTDDMDYLCAVENDSRPFITGEGVDLINANGHKLFAEIFATEMNNDIATPQSLFDLKAFAFVQHCQNLNFAKADACEYDLKFLARKYNCVPMLVKKYVSNGELSEINKVIKK